MESINPAVVGWMARSLLAALALAGCVPIQPPAPPAKVERIAFPTDEYASLPNARATGTAELRGQAFMKTRGGDVKVAAGEEVMLNPVTSYSWQWFEESYTKHRPMEPADERLWNWVRKTQADAQGRFTFRKVPVGRYYVVTKVTWEAPTGYGLSTQGGFIAKEVELSDGGELEVILTR